MAMISPRSVLITGASSGIGAALALAYAEPGRRLALGGRDENRLAAVAEQCRARGADVTTRALDITDREAVAAWIADAAVEAPDARLDLVIANAGISGSTGGVGRPTDNGGAGRPANNTGGGSHGGQESAEQVRRIFAVNVDGVLNTVLPAVPKMRDQAPVTLAGTPPWRGQIAIVSSVVGFRGFPGAPAYSASKAAVKAWGEALRGALKPDGIAVSVVCPGFIRTPMTAGNPFPMPFLMEPERAAAIIKRGLERNQARIAFPWPHHAAAWLAGMLPPSWIDPLLSRLPKKPARAAA
jgi:NAD(P)-dependent dehydrogenase (short-subunit alcohol dehydrogenase family)